MRLREKHALLYISFLEHYRNVILMLLLLSVRVDSRTSAQDPEPGKIHAEVAPKRSHLILSEPKYDVAAFHSIPQPRTGHSFSQAQHQALAIAVQDQVAWQVQGLESLEQVSWAPESLELKVE